MPVILKEVTTEVDLAATIDCLWAGYFDPYLSFMQILFPIHENTTEGYAQAVASSKAGLWASHSQDKSSRWVAVVDSESGEVLAGAHWNFHEVSRSSMVLRL